MGDGENVLVAGWPVVRQHPRGQDGTVFVTIEDETGDVQLIQERRASRKGKPVTQRLRMSWKALRQPEKRWESWPARKRSEYRNTQQ